VLRKRVGATYVRCELKNFKLYVTLHTTPLTMCDTRITRGQFSDIYNLAGKSYVCRSSKRWTELRLGWFMSCCFDNRYCSDVISHRLTVTCTSSRSGQFQSRYRKFRWLLHPTLKLRNTLCARLPCCYFTFNDIYVKEIACFFQQEHIISVQEITLLVAGV
jgi:hypothetical protein